MKKNILFLLLAFFAKISFSQQPNPTDSLKIYLQLGRDYSLKADWVNSNANLVAAQRIATARNDTAALCKIHFFFGKISGNSQDNEGLKNSIGLAEMYCQACRDSAILGKVFFLKAILNYNLKQMEASKAYFLQSSEMFFALRDTLTAANSLVKVGNVLDGQGKYSEANVYYLKFYQTAKNQPDEGILMLAHLYLASNYVYLKDAQKCYFHAMEVQRIAKKLDRKFEFWNALEYEAAALRLMGKYDEAFEKMRHYAYFYKDTLINAERVEQIETLKTQYETEKKETQIVLQNAELSNQKRTIWGVSGTLAVVLVGGFFLFRLNRKLKQRNREKEFLIKEIHHRVKNNLQVLSSLLHLQSRHIRDETALDAVREGQNRVEAMGLIHQKLYMGENLAAVEMTDFLRELGDTLLDSFGMDERVAVKLAVEPIRLDVDTAVPLGLIVNELLTNSLKYGFPDGRRGQVEIQLRKEPSGKLFLKISDDGVGAAAVRDEKKSTGFGGNLVEMLSKKLKGKPEVVVSETGFSTSIRFENFKMV